MNNLSHSNEVTQHEEDFPMKDALSWADKSQSEDVSDDETGLSVPAPTPVDVGDLDSLARNLEIDSSDASEEYTPSDLPPNFPAQIGRLIRHIPPDEPGAENIRGFAVELITLLFGSGTPEDILLFQQLAALLEQAPPGIICAIEDMITDLVSRCTDKEGIQDFSLDLFARDHSETWGRPIMTWLFQIPDQILEDIFGIPVTGDNLQHLLAHIWFDRGEDNNVSIFLETCPDSDYTPKASEKTVQYFIDSLPEVPLESLAEDDRECGICREVYTEGPSLLNGVPESAVRLPCGHVFGDLCLTVLLSPNSEGWERRLCPLCRAVVPLLPKHPLAIS